MSFICTSCIYQKKKQTILNLLEQIEYLRSINGSEKIIRQLLDTCITLRLENELKCDRCNGKTESVENLEKRLENSHI